METEGSVLKKICESQAHNDIVWHVSWSPDGRYLATSSADRSIRVLEFNGSTLSEVATVRGHEKTVRRTVWSENGDFLASASFDSSARIWSKASGYSCVASLRTSGLDSELKGLDWNGDYIATTSRDRTVWVWQVSADMSDPTLQGVLSGHNGDVKSVKFLTPSILVSCSFDGSLMFWVEHKGDWNEAGKAALGAATLWEVANLSPSWTRPDSTSCYEYAGRLLVSSEEGLSLWACDSKNTPIASRVAEFPHPRAVLGVSASRDGRMAATACLDNRVRLFSVTATDLLLVDSATLSDDINAVAFSPCGKYLASVGDDRLLRIWSVQ